MKIFSHVPFFKIKQNTIVPLFFFFHGKEATWPSHLRRKHILDKRATCDSTTGYIPHPQNLFLSLSLTCEPEKKVDCSVQNCRCLRKHIFVHMFCELT